MKGERMKWNEEIFPILVSSEDKREWHNKEVCSKMHSASIFIKKMAKGKRTKDISYNLAFVSFPC